MMNGRDSHDLPEVTLADLLLFAALVWALSQTGHSLKGLSVSLPSMHYQSIGRP